MKKIILMSLLCISTYVHGMRKQSGMPSHYHAHMQGELISLARDVPMQPVFIAQEVNRPFSELQIDEIALRDRRTIRSERTGEAIKISTKPIDYSYFFELCGKGDIDAVEKFIRQHPTIDIEHKNEHGATAALHTADALKWSVTFHLLEKHGANKMACDNYGLTILAHEIYIPMDKFKKLLQMYSLDELNTLCKTIGFQRDCGNLSELDMPETVKEISAILENKEDIHEKDIIGNTALHDACAYNIIPLIIKLIEAGADLDMQNTRNRSSYGILKNKRAALFVVRETFNNGPCVPAALICRALEALKEENNDVANYIKQLYCKATLSDDSFFESPKARIWKPVCTDVCKMLKVDTTDERRCLATVMVQSQHTLTEMNIRLALENK